MNLLCGVGRPAVRLYLKDNNTAAGLANLKLVVVETRTRGFAAAAEKNSNNFEIRRRILNALTGAASFSV